MYENYFHLRARPFENTPDPSFFFMEGQYRDALAVLKYQVVYQKGITAVVGPSGCGKTTLGNVLLSHLPKDTKIVYIVFLRASPVELLDYLAQELGVVTKGLSTLGLIKSIRAKALEIHGNSRQCFLVLDEAQNMDEELLGEIQLLSNLETAQTKLIQVLLLGRKELLDRLNQPRLDALRQRIAVIKELGPMNEREVSAYVHRRLAVAGGSPDLFAPEALVQVTVISGGYPRNINKICDMGLLKAFISGKTQVGSDQLFEASAELGFTFSRPQSRVIPRTSQPKVEKSDFTGKSSIAPEVFPVEQAGAPSNIRPAGPDTQGSRKALPLESAPSQSPGHQRTPKPERPRTEPGLMTKGPPGQAASRSRSTKPLWLALLVVILGALLGWNFGLITEWLPFEKAGSDQSAPPGITLHGKVEPIPMETSDVGQTATPEESEGDQAALVSTVDMQSPAAPDSQTDEAGDPAPTQPASTSIVPTPEKKTGSMAGVGCQSSRRIANHNCG